MRGHGGHSDRALWLPYKSVGGTASRAMELMTDRTKDDEELPL
jgi:hypothetical protein